MDKKICLITGANAGIGKAAAIQIAQKGLHVVMVCRDQRRGLQALEEVKQKSGSDSVELLVADMSLQSSVKQMAEMFQSKYDRLDVLISNAAAFDMSQKKPIITQEGIESVWATNQVGPVLMIKLLMEPLKKSPQGRILTVASQGLMLHPFLKVDLIDPEYKTRKFDMASAYYQSKLAQVMYTYWLSNQLKDTNITVNCVRVTNVAIDINRYPNLSKLHRFAYSIKSKKAITPEEMAKTYTYLATSSDVEKVTGKYFDQYRKQVQSSKYSYDENNIEKVMKLTMSYIKE